MPISAIATREDLEKVAQEEKKSENKIELVVVQADDGLYYTFRRDALEKEFDRLKEEFNQPKTSSKPAFIFNTKTSSIKSKSFFKKFAFALYRILGAHVPQALDLHDQND